MIKWYKQIDVTAIKTFLDSIIELINILSIEVDNCCYMSKKQELTRLLYLLKTYELKVNEIYKLAIK